MREKNTTVNHSVSGAFIFLLLGLFAVFGTVMVVLGVRAYRSTDAKTTEHNEYRILSSYVRSMVRPEDGYADIRIEEVDGIDTLTLEETFGTNAYVTRIYCVDGMLREWYANADYDLEPEKGTAICEAKDFKAELDGQLLKVSILTKEDEWISVDIGLISKL